jgi:hypothetical protein
MATGTANPNWHGQLAANTVDTIIMSKAWSALQVINVDGASRIDYTFDGTTPAVGGTATGRVLPAAIGADQAAGFRTDQPITIKLISAGTPHYSIIGGQ